MSRSVFSVIVHFLVFWVVTDNIEGITVYGILSYLILGGVWGILMLTPKRLIIFFTLDANVLVILTVCVLYGIITFTVYNFLAAGIDIGEGAVGGYSTSFITISTFRFGMAGNIIAGGIILGLVSGGLLLLSETGRD